MSIFNSDGTAEGEMSKMIAFICLVGIVALIGAIVGIVIIIQKVL